MGFDDESGIGRGRGLSSALYRTSSTEEREDVRMKEGGGEALISHHL